MPLGKLTFGWQFDDMMPTELSLPCYSPASIEEPTLHHLAADATYGGGKRGLRPIVPEPKSNYAERGATRVDRPLPSLVILDVL
jgi:hypothetical protein